MKNRKGFTVVELFIAILVLLLSIGWFANLYRFVTCDFAEPYKAEVIYGIGVFVPPVGAVTGYISIEDGNTVPKHDEKNP